MNCLALKKKQPFISIDGFDIYSNIFQKLQSIQIQYHGAAKFLKRHYTQAWIFNWIIEVGTTVNSKFSSYTEQKKIRKFFNGLNFSITQ